MANCEGYVKRGCSIIAILLALTSVAEAQTVTLRYRWTKGESLSYRSVLQNDSTISGMPGMGDMNVGQTMTQVIKTDVTDVAPDGTATLKQTFLSVRMEMATPMGKVVYDSAAPSANTADPISETVGKFMGRMVGESIVTVMGPDGRIRKVEGASAILDKALQGLGSDPASAAMAQSLRSVMSDDAMRSNLEQTFAGLPLPPVKQGDTWKGSINIGNEMIGRITGIPIFTLKAIEGDTARIGVTVTLKQESAPTGGPMGMSLKIAESKGEGEIVFDVAAGRMRRSTMRTELPATMTMTTPDGTTATMNNLTKTTMTMELVEK